MLPALNTWLVVDLKEAKVLRAAGLPHHREAEKSYLRLYHWSRGRGNVYFPREIGMKEH